MQYTMHAAAHLGEFERALNHGLQVEADEAGTKYAGKACERFNST